MQERWLVGLFVLGCGLDCFEVVTGSPVLSRLAGASPIVDEVGVARLPCHFPQAIAQLNRCLRLALGLALGLGLGRCLELCDQLLEVVATHCPKAVGCDDFNRLAVHSQAQNLAGVAYCAENCLEDLASDRFLVCC